VGGALAQATVGQGLALESQARLLEQLSGLSRSQI
jgi:hypothetical protein